MHTGLYHRASDLPQQLANHGTADITVATINTSSFERHRQCSIEQHSPACQLDDHACQAPSPNGLKHVENKSAQMFRHFEGDRERRELGISSRPVTRKTWSPRSMTAKLKTATLSYVARRCPLVGAGLRLRTQTYLVPSPCDRTKSESRGYGRSRWKWVSTLAIPSTRVHWLRFSSMSTSWQTALQESLPREPRATLLYGVRRGRRRCRYRGKARKEEF